MSRGRRWNPVWEQATGWAGGTEPPYGAASDPSRIAAAPHDEGDLTGRPVELVGRETYRWDPGTALPQSHVMVDRIETADFESAGLVVCVHEIEAWGPETAASVRVEIVEPPPDGVEGRAGNLPVASVALRHGISPPWLATRRGARAPGQAVRVVFEWTSDGESDRPRVTLSASLVVAARSRIESLASRPTREDRPPRPELPRFETGARIVRTVGDIEARGFGVKD